MTKEKGTPYTGEEQGRIALGVHNAIKDVAGIELPYILIVPMRSGSGAHLISGLGPEALLHNLITAIEMIAEGTPSVGLVQKDDGTVTEMSLEQLMSRIRGEKPN